MSSAEKQRVSLKPLYDPRRALEHAQTVQDVQGVPVRLFAALFQLWEIETTAMQEEGRPYELIERYVERGMAEGNCHTVQNFVAFFGLQEEIVRRVLQFLRTVGHVQQRGDSWDLTPLGRKSLQAGTRYVEQEKRVKFYFDAFTSKPLRKEHYNEKKRARIFAPEEAAEIIHAKTFGYRFRFISSTNVWRAEALHELAARVDKRDYNVPPEMKRIDFRSIGTAYLPMYIIETRKVSTGAGASGQSDPFYKPYYLVYTGIREMRDQYFERIINSNLSVYAALSSEKIVSPSDLWHTWLNERGIDGAIPLERADGTWYVALPAAVFEGKQTKLTIGDYELRDGYFMQIWCEDPALRRQAALDRVLRTVKSQQRYIKRQAVQEQLRLVAQQLKTTELTLDLLRQRARESGMGDIISVLDALR